MSKTTVICFTQPWSSLEHHAPAARRICAPTVRRAAMPKTSRKPEGSNARFFGLGIVVVSLVIGVIVVTAIFFRSGGFSVVAQSQGTSIKIDFAESRIELSQFLNQGLRGAE